MPEAHSGLLYAYAPEPPKKPAIIKVTCGIGDTDGFPALDVESDAYATKDDSKWGFLITGGAEFHMPLTVFQVTPDGLADKGGIRLGDIILEINEEDAAQLTLAQAHEKINATGKKVHFLVKCMDDDDTMGDYEPGEEKSIVLRVPKPMAPPSVISIEARLRAMQRKLSEIAEIPKILSSTLATVSQTFDKLMPADQKSAARRKYSYDEDALDYELSDVDADEDDEVELSEQERTGSANQKQAKEVTPESDYASETNYAGNGADAGNANNLNGDDDGEDDEDDFETDGSDGEYTVNYAVMRREAARLNKSVDSVIEEDAEEDEEDFLSTTYTWNLRNVPKLQLNDVQNKQLGSDNDSNSDNVSNESQREHKGQTQAKWLIEDGGTEEGLGRQQQTPLEQQQLFSPEKQAKMDKFERSWPWADRAKIIYKQSTCHLVPRSRPLGIVEQRMQLLAKQHLMDNLHHVDKPQ